MTDASAKSEQAVMLTAARHLDLNPAAAQIVSSSSRVIWHLPAARAALTISRSGTKANHDVVAESAAVRAARTAGVRTPDLVGGPIELDDRRFALAYEWISGRRCRSKDWLAVGAEAARLADAPRDNVPTLQWPSDFPDPRWLDVLGEHLASTLIDLCGRASAVIASMLTCTDELVLCHGDLQPANVLVDRGGQPWLIDLEYACLAPPEWDPAKVFILSRRFGDPPGADGVLAAWPPLDLSRLAECIAAQETQIVAWLARMAVDGTPGAAAEARRRARTLTGDSLMWQHLG